MTQNRGLEHLIIIAFCLAVLAAGCAGGPPTWSQSQVAAKNPPTSGGYGEETDSDGWLFRWLTGRNQSVNETSQTTSQPSPNVAVSPNQPPLANTGNPQPIVQTSAIEPGPSAGIPTSSAIASTVATEPIGEDNSTEFPIVILPPQPTSAPPPPK